MSAGERSPPSPAFAWLVVGLVVAVPLLFDPGGYFAFLPLKWTAANVLVWAGLGALLVATKGLPRQTGGRIWLVLLAAIVTSAVLGVSRWTSILGYPGRYLGVLAWGTFFAAYVLGSALAGDHVRRAALAMSCSSIVVSGYALLQAVGVDPITWSPYVNVERTRSTLGNAAFLGAYLVLVVPFTSRLAMSTRGRTRIVHITAAAVGVTALLTTQTRGAWLGTVAGLVVIGALEFERLKRAKRSVAIAAAAGGVLIVLLATVSPFAGRIRSIADPEAATGRGRIMQWERTIEMIASRPALGWGPDTYAIAFPRFIDAEFERFVRRDVVPDRAHNVFLDLAATTGTLGTVAYGGLLIVVALAAWRRRREPHVVAAAGACAAYVGQLQFSFPLVDLDVVFWLLAGIVAGRSGGQRLVPSRAWSIVPLSIAAAFAVWGTTDVVADRALRSGLNAEARSDLDLARRDVDRAMAISMARAQYAQAAARLHRRVGEATSSIEELEVGIKILDAAEHLVRGDVELALDRGDLFLSLGQVSGERASLLQASRIYEAVLERDPASSRAHLKLGVALAELGRLQQAETEWLAASDLAPHSAAPLRNLAQLYREVGRDKDADRVERRLSELDE